MYKTMNGEMDEKLIQSQFEYRADNKDGVNTTYTITKIKSIDENGNVVFPNSIDGKPVTMIMATYYGPDIAEIIVPSNISRIHMYSPKFVIKKISIDKNNPYLSTDGSMLFDKEKKRLLTVYVCDKKEYSIPDTVESIAEEAFAWCQDMETIMIPDSVTEIKKGAFSRCWNLRNVSGGKNITSICNGAFKGTPWYSEEEFAILGKHLIKCNAISREISIPEGVEYIADIAVSHYGLDLNDETIHINVPNSVRVIGKEAFYGRSKVKRIILPKGVEKIDSGAFESCRELEEICLPEAIDEIADKLFRCCYQLKEITIPQGVWRIGTAAFSNCKMLTQLNLPESLIEIGENSFENCLQLSEVVIPKNVEKIGCDSFTQITISKKDSVNLSKFVVDENNKVYKSIDGILYSKDEKRIICVPMNYSAKKFQIPESVEVVGKCCFKGSQKINTILIHSGVKSIEEAAFDRALISKVVLPDNLKVLSKMMFYGCSKLKTIQLPKQIKEIGVFCFAYSGLKEVTMPEALERINDYAFAEIKAKKVTLPSTVKSIGISILAGVPEIEIYDTLDENAKDAYEYLDDGNGTPNSNIGWIGIFQNVGYTRCAASPNSTWYDHMITVKAADTAEIKYKVWMCGLDENRGNYCMLSSSWGKYATFAFERLDNCFESFKKMENKTKIAMSRLDYPYKLSEECKIMYSSYLKKVGSKAIVKFVENGDMEAVEAALQSGLITKSNVDKLAALAMNSKQKDIQTYLIEYKKQHL